MPRHPARLANQRHATAADARVGAEPDRAGLAGPHDDLERRAARLAFSEANDGHQPRFLVISDEPSLRRALENLLSTHGSLHLVGTPELAAAEFASSTWGAFIIAVAALEAPWRALVRSTRLAHAATPLLVVTGEADAEAVRSCYAAGADYLVAPLEQALVDRFFAAHKSFADRIEVTLRAWRKRYNLTAAQEDVLGRAANGEGREAIAVSRQTTFATVKRQVFDLLQKTADESLHGAVERLMREALGAGREPYTERRIEPRRIAL